MSEKIKRHIFNILDEFGIYVSSYDMKKDIDLREYLVDSLQFIYFIVEFEDRLSISIPDDILTYDSISSINGFTNMMAELCDDVKYIR